MRKEMRWRFQDMLAGWTIAALLVALTTYLLPASIWFQVDAVAIANAKPHISPAMAVDRTIHWPFVGTWVVTILKNDNGDFQPYCYASGTNDYSPESKLPRKLDLDWWTWPKKCDLPEGQYVARTVWEFTVLGFITKDVRMVSNVFTIREEALS